MKNQPTKIFLDLGFTPDMVTDFDELTEVTWSKDNASGEGIEYVRSDIAKAEAEKMAKEFKIWLSSNEFRTEKITNDIRIMVFTLDDTDELFTEFLNSRKK